MRPRSDIYIPGVTAPTYAQKLAEQIPMVLAILGTLGILLATLFPMDFRFERPMHEFQWDVSAHSSAAKIRDIGSNIIMFIPVGLGVAARVMRGSFRRRNIAVLLAGLYGCLLSVGVEFLQHYLPQRDPALVDILANTLGAIVGAWIVRGYGESTMHRLPRLISNEFERPSARLFGTLLLLCMAWPLALAGLYIGSLSLDDWDPTARLAVGNELRDQREWTGSVSELHFAARALESGELARVFAGESVADVAGDSLAASYRLQGDHDYRDATGKQPTLQWVHERNVDDEGVPHFTHARSVATTQPARDLHHQIRDSDAFTLITTIATEELFQTNDARVITFSNDAHIRNVTLTQNDAALAIRIRNGITGSNGRQPELLLPDFFTDTQPQRLVVTYDKGQVRAYVDGVEQAYAVDFTPASSIVWASFPRSTWALRMGHAPTTLHAWLFYTLAFVPMGVLTAVQTTLIRHERRPWLFFACLLLPPIALQALFTYGYQRKTDWLEMGLTVALSLAIGIYTFLRLRQWRRVVVSERY